MDVIGVADLAKLAYPPIPRCWVRFSLPTDGSPPLPSDRWGSPGRSPPARGAPTRPFKASAVSLASRPTGAKVTGWVYVPRGDRAFPWRMDGMSSRPTLASERALKLPRRLQDVLLFTGRCCLQNQFSGMIPVSPSLSPILHYHNELRGFAQRFQPLQQSTPDLNWPSQLLTEIRFPRVRHPQIMPRVSSPRKPKSHIFWHSRLPDMETGPKKSTGNGCELFVIREGNRVRSPFASRPAMSQIAS